MNGAQGLRAAFRDQGFALVRDLLPSKILLNIQDKVSVALNELAERDRLAFPHQGSMRPLSIEDDDWLQLIGSKQILDVIHEIGGSDVRWLSGYLISKPPHSSRLWWHQDWWAWHHPISCQPMPAQLSAMVYPFGATVTNGCLRVIPESHRWRHKLHDVLPEAHSVEANSLMSSHVAFADQPDETSVEVAPSDVVFCDVRLLHATHANSSNFERPCLTLWYLPNFDRLPEEFRAHYTQHPCQPPVAKRAGLRPVASHLVIPPASATPAPVLQLERSPVSL